MGFSHSTALCQLGLFGFGVFGGDPPQALVVRMWSVTPRNGEFGSAELEDLLTAVDSGMLCSDTAPRAGAEDPAGLNPCPSLSPGRLGLCSAHSLALHQ